MGYTLQLCRGDRDITSELFAEDHADEVRVWMEGADEPYVFDRDTETGLWSFSDAYASGENYRTLGYAMDAYRVQVPECGF